MMFGFDETIEIELSPIQEFQHSLRKMIAFIDSTKNYDAAFLDELCALKDDANEKFSALSITEQAKPNNYWSSVLMMINTILQFKAIPSMFSVQARAYMPNIRTNTVNTLAQVS